MSRRDFIIGAIACLLAVVGVTAIFGAVGALVVWVIGQ